MALRYKSFLFSETLRSFLKGQRKRTSGFEQHDPEGAHDLFRREITVSVSVHGKRCQLQKTTRSENL
jgi:hypothetical protein